MPLPTPVEWDIIDARVKRAKSSFRSRDDSQAFLALVLRQYFPEIGDEILEIITDGPGDLGIDAVKIIETDDVARIYLFQSKYRSSVLHANKTINADEVLKIIQFIRDLHNKSAQLIGRGNFAIQQSASAIWSLYARGIQCFYDVVFCSNDQGLAPDASAMLDAFRLEYPHVTHSQYLARDFIRASTERRSHPENGQLRVVGRQVFDRSDGDVRGLVASIDATSYIRMIADAQGSVKRHLFDDNLRIFLGSNAGYNPAIIGTASSSDSYLFWYLNNGVTITCKNFGYNKGISDPIINMENFQIVNGAQTSYSLAEAFVRSPEALQQVVLTARVYATDRADVTERVAVATNSQARIQDRDLRANSPILKKLEAAFSTRGVYFERKRGMHADKPASTRLDALKLGQILMSFYLREPDRARTESDSIFDSRFKEVFREDYDIDEILRVVKFYGKIEWLREDFVGRYGSAIENTGDYQYLVYGHWFILFAAKLLLAQTNDPVPSEDEPMGKLAERAIEVVARACNQNKQVAHYQMFRSPKTKEKIVSEIMGKQMELFVF